MTPEQRYFFDVSGYIHLEKALGDGELKQAQDAADRYIHTPPGELPPGFELDDSGKINSSSRRYIHGFAFDRALESLALHPKTWPIIKELTGNRPRLASGTLQVNTHDRPGTRLHCAREGSWQTTRYECRDGRIFCNNFVVFPYLTDVHPGDGGLIVIPGSHKAQFPRPPGLFYSDNGIGSHIPPGVVNIIPSAGDMVIISELLTHGTLPWNPVERDRRVLILRYRPQYCATYSSLQIPAEVKDRLAPETRELVEPASYGHVKTIVETEKAAFR